MRAGCGRITLRRGPVQSAEGAFDGFHLSDDKAVFEKELRRLEPLAGATSERAVRIGSIASSS